jgi:hypothetical protein
LVGVAAEPTCRNEDMKTWLLIGGLVFLGDGLCDTWLNPYFSINIPDELTVEADDHRLIATKIILNHQS